MTNESSNGPIRIDGGLLADSELDQIVQMYAANRSPADIDDFASSLLLGREAIGSWEASARQAGVQSMVFGRHRALEMLRSGDTYDVVVAQHLFLGRLEILKIIRSVPAPPEVVAAHLRRIEVHAKAPSPNIVRLHDASCIGARHFVVVEHLNGTDMRSLIRRSGPLKARLASAIAIRTAIGLEEIHGMGYVHGGLEPTKILIPQAEGGSVKLCDAGRGIPLGVESQELTNVGGRALDFLAPEVIAGEQATVLSDIYSLGCLLYYAVTSKVPFPGGTDEEKRARLASNYPLDPRRLSADLHDDFVAVIAAMMSKTPTERIQSTGEVVARLEPWAGGTNVDIGTLTGTLTAER